MAPAGKHKSLTLQHSGGTKVSESYQHEICEHLNIVVVLQPVLHMVQELEDVQTVQTRVQQCVHALKGSLELWNKLKYKV